MWRTIPRTWIGRTALVASLVALPVTVAACGSKSSAATTPSASPSASASASATTQITADWQKFFAGTTAAAAKQALLQNGAQFASVLQAQAGSAIAKATTATVSAVTVTSPTTASVTYSIVQGGQVALPDQKGQAVLEGGVWKVSAASFQALLKLEQGAGSTSPSASP
jgi:uncharacterized lipoprotein YbaY